MVVETDVLGWVCGMVFGFRLVLCCRWEVVGNVCGLVVRFLFAWICSFMSMVEYFSCVGFYGRWGGIKMKKSKFLFLGCLCF